MATTKPALAQALGFRANCLQGLQRPSRLLTRVAYSRQRRFSPPADVSRQRLQVDAVTGRDHNSGFTRATPKKGNGQPVEQAGGVGLTKQNELFLGRFAMIGFSAALLVEAVSGRGVLAHLDVRTAVPLAQADPLALALVAAALLAAVGALGDRGRFEDEERVAEGGRYRGTIQQALGLDDRGPLLGMSKASELLVARVAEVGIAATLLGELLTGHGVLTHLNVATGVPLTQVHPSILSPIMFLLLAAVHPGTGRFVNED